MLTSRIDAWMMHQAVNSILFHIFEAPPDQQALLLLAMSSLCSWLGGERSFEAVLDELWALGKAQNLHELRRSEEQMQ